MIVRTHRKVYKHLVHPKISTYNKQVEKRIKFNSKQKDIIMYSYKCI